MFGIQLTGKQGDPLLLFAHFFLHNTRHGVIGDNLFLQQLSRLLLQLGAFFSSLSRDAFDFHPLGYLRQLKRLVTRFDLG